ncbi:MAG: thioredoxin family protein [Chloroflexi bacterium]|nr:thioredoxin family protein [Chloroflexota bacterium]
MPGWQAFYEAHRHENFEILSVAVDMQGPELSRPWHTVARATFTTVVDQENTLAPQYGAKLIPNGIFVAADGTIRLKWVGGFDVAKPECVTAIEKLLGGDPELIYVPSRITPRDLPAAERELIATKVRLGHALLALDRPGEAVAEWRWALYYDPDDLTVRKQIWMVEHPEKFLPTIDGAWQKVQLAQEREEEARQQAAGCGPDGCPLP